MQQGSAEMVSGTALKSRHGGKAGHVVDFVMVYVGYVSGAEDLLKAASAGRLHVLPV